MAELKLLTHKVRIFNDFWANVFKVIGIYEQAPQTESEYQDLDNENNHMETVFLGILDKDKKDAVFTDNLNDEAVTSEKIDSELFTGVETTGRENYEENMPDYRLNINL